jgi:hypothetical protein
MSKRKSGIVALLVAAFVFCVVPWAAARNLTPKYADLHCDSDDDCAPGQQCQTPNNTLPLHCYPLIRYQGSGSQDPDRPGPFKTECTTDRDCDPPLTCHKLAKNPDGSLREPGNCSYP